MAQQNSDFKEAFAALMVEESATHASEIDLEGLLAYHEGRLPAEQREAMRKQLHADPEALELLDDLAAFEEVSDTSAPASRFEVESTLHGVRAKLDAQRATPRQRRLTQFLAATHPWQLAAVLSAVALGLSLWLAAERRMNHHLRTELTGLNQPRADLVIHQLAPESALRSGELQHTKLEEPSRGGWSILVLTLVDAPADVEGYDAEIRAAEQNLVWQGELVLGAHSTFTLGLPDSTFATPLSDRYEILLYGRRGTQRELLERYHLEVRRPTAGSP